jgi:hypothetical protein
MIHFFFYKKKLIEWSDELKIDLILTTGGTGKSLEYYSIIHDFY